MSEKNSHKRSALRGALSAANAAGTALPAHALIDPLEQRLLYSADHPLGIAVSAGDLQDELSLFDDAQLVSSLLDVLRQQPLNDDTQGLLDDGTFGLEVITVTTQEDTVDAIELNSLDELNSSDFGDDGKVSLREAIIVANNDSTVGRIIVPAGSYKLELDLSDPSDDNNEEGDLDLNGTFVIEGDTEGTTTIIQTVEDRRVFEVRDNAYVSFENLTISGHFDVNGDQIVNNSGSAAFVQPNASANFDSVTMSDMTTHGRGGAIHVQGAVTLTNVVISGNQSELAGGGVWVDAVGVLTMTGGEITENQATDDGTGGGLHVAGNATLNGVTVQRNTAGGVGGGLYLGDDDNDVTTVAVANIITSSIERNTSNDDGGGIYSDGVLTINGGNITDNNVTNDEASVQTRGGGLYVKNDSMATVSSLRIAGNTADSAGAGIYTEGRLILSSASVASHNGSNEGAGIYVTEDGHATLSEVGVSRNAATVLGGGIYNEGKLEVTSDMSLDNNSAESGGAIYNAGELEITNAFVAKNGAVSGAGVYSEDYFTMNKTVVNENGAVTGGGIYGESGLEMMDSDVFGNSSTKGGGIYSDGVLTILNSRVNNNNAETGGGIYSESNLVIRDSSIYQNNSSAGGGIYNKGTAQLTNVQFSENEAAQGGGIYSEGDLTVEREVLDFINDSKFLSNKAERGGGIYSTGQLKISDTEFSDNSVDSADLSSALNGGALYLSDGIAEIDNSTFLDNKSAGSAAGIYNEAELTLSDSRLIDNVAMKSGGGLVNSGTGVATLERVTVWGNEALESTIVGGGGGGIYNGVNGVLDVRYSVVANNTSTQNAAGIFSLGKADISNSRILSNASASGNVSGGIGFASSDRILTISNSVVANNTLGGDSADVSANEASVTSVGFNLIETATNIDLQGTDITNVDPGFGFIPTDIDSSAGGLSVDLNPDSIFYYDEQVQYAINNTSATLHTGSTAGTGDITIDGTVVGDVPHIGGFTYDVTNGMVFWIGNDGNIYRSDADFTYAQIIIDSTDLVQPVDIEVDIEDQRIYWLSQASNAILSAELDGTDIQTVQQVDVNAIEFVLDKENERFFTLSNGDSSNITQYFYTQVDTSETEQPPGEVVYTSDSSLKALELDQTEDVLYCAEAGGTGAAILMSLQTQASDDNLSGHDAQIVVDDSMVVNNPSSIAVIEYAAQVFWTEPDTQQLVRFDEDALPQTLTHEYSSPSVPEEIEYDILNDRILVAGQQLSVYWINSEFDEFGEVGSVPQVINDMAYAPIESLTATPEQHALEIRVNSGQSVVKGESEGLSAAVLSVTDADASANRIVYSLDSPVSDITIYRNEAEVTRFSQDDIDSDRIRIEHSGIHIGTGTSWEIILPFTVSDNSDESISSDQSITVNFKVTVTGSNVPPMHEYVTNTEHYEVLEGKEFELDNSVLKISDVDTGDAEVIIEIRDQAGGQIWVDGSLMAIGDTFTLEQLKSSELSPDSSSGIVEYRHSGDEPLVTDSYIELAIRDQESELVSIPRIEIAVRPDNDNAPQTQNQTATGKHDTLINTIVTEDNATSTTLLYGLIDLDLPFDSHTVIVTEEPAGDLQWSGDGAFSYTAPEEAEVDRNYEDSFKYRIVDEAGVRSAEATVTVFVQALQAPKAEEALADQLVEENDLFTLTLPETLFSSPEGEQAQPFSWQVADPGSLDGQLPDWLMFEESIRKLSGMPQDQDTGELQLEVRVTDSNGLESLPVSLNIEVRNINHQPTITGSNLLAVPENSAGFELGQVQARDNDSDTLTYIVEDSRFKFDGNTLQLKEAESLDFEAASAFSVTVQVFDGTVFSETQDLDVEVLDKNDVPQVDVPLEAQVLDADSSVVLSVDAFTDQDNESLVYSVTTADGSPLPDWIVFDSETTELSLGVAPAENSIEQLILSVDDGRGGTAQMTFVVQYFAQAELSLGEATPTEETTSADTNFDFDFVTPSAVSLIQVSDNDSAESDAAFSEQVEGRVEQDSSQVVASVAINSLTDLLSNNTADSIQAQVLNNTVISEHLTGQRTDFTRTLELNATPDIFDQSVNIASLFATAQAQDPGMFALLADNFEKRQQAVEQVNATSRIILGSSISLTSGLSVGYFLYLLRGGAIMSSMLTSLPAWRFVDPLPILNSLGDSDDTDNESLQTIVSKKH